jgi:tellurium resistance protein TerZ
MKSLMHDLLPGLHADPRECMVFLGRDENIAISKLAPAPVAAVSVGVRWDKTSGEFVDLDLGCMMLGVDASLVDYASFVQKSSRDGAVTHAGDNADLPGVVDKETMHVDLSALSDDVHFLAFYLSSFTGRPLKDMNSCDVTLLDSSSSRPLVMCDCDSTGDRQHTAVLLCLLVRTKTGWYFQNASSYSEGLLLRDNLEHLQGYVISNAAILRAMTRHRRDSI